MGALMCRCSLFRVHLLLPLNGAVGVSRVVKVWLFSLPSLEVGAVVVDSHGPLVQQVEVVGEAEVLLSQKYLSHCFACPIDYLFR